MCYDRSHLYSLLEKYSIKTSIELIESVADTAFCEIILESNSLEYEFCFFESGKVTVEEYSFASKNLATYNIESLKNEKTLKSLMLKS